MKKTRIVLSALLALVMALGLVACGNKNNDEKNSAALVGTYKLDSVTIHAKGEDEDLVYSLSDASPQIAKNDVVLTLKSGGTLELNIKDLPLIGTELEGEYTARWDLEKNALKFSAFAGGAVGVREKVQKVTPSFSGDTVTLKYMGNDIVPELLEDDDDTETCMNIVLKKSAASSSASGSVTSVTIDAGSSFTVTLGETKKLSATTEGDEEAEVTWSSSDPSIAYIDAEGNLTPISYGNVTITAKAGDKTQTTVASVGVPTSLQSSFWVGSPSDYTQAFKNLRDFGKNKSATNDSRDYYPALVTYKGKTDESNGRTGRDGRIGITVDTFTFGNAAHTSLDSIRHEMFDFDFVETVVGKRVGHVTSASYYKNGDEWAVSTSSSNTYDRYYQATTNSFDQYYKNANASDWSYSNSVDESYFNWEIPEPGHAWNWLDFEDALYNIISRKSESLAFLFNEKTDDAHKYAVYSESKQMYLSGVTIDKFTYSSGWNGNTDGYFTGPVHKNNPQTDKVVTFKYSVQSERSNNKPDILSGAFALNNQYRALDGHVVNNDPRTERLAYFAFELKENGKYVKRIINFTYGSDTEVVIPAEVLAKKPAVAA